MVRLKYGSGCKGTMQGSHTGYMDIGGGTLGFFIGELLGSSCARSQIWYMLNIRKTPDPIGSLLRWDILARNCIPSPRPPPLAPALRCPKPSAS